MTRSVTQAFLELLERQSLTPNQKQIAATRIQALTTFFNNQFNMNQNIFPMGSYSRGTMCAGERDIDLMAPFNAYGNTNYWQRYNTNSSNFIYWIREILNDRYATTDVSTKQVAVTLDFNVIKVDLVPCFIRQDGNGFLIPNGKGGWQSTNPKYHNQLINNSDVQHIYKLKPVIKLAKIWNNVNGHHLRSFHVELMVEAMWHERTIPTLPAAMKETLRVFSGWVQEPFSDPWDDSVNIDSYLSRETRTQVVRMLDEDASSSDLAEKYRNSGNEEKAFERWQMVFRHNFPVRIY